MIREVFLLIRYQLADVARAKWMVAYALFFFFFTNALLMFGSDSSKAAASVLSVVLLVVPMISILYAAIHWYNSESFNSLLLTHPLRRSSVYLSHWISISSCLAGSLAFSTGSALVFNRSFDRSSATVLLFGCVLSFIFVGLGLAVAVLFKDRMRGIGAAFLLWLYFSVLHDALVFALISLFKDFPIEVPTIVLMSVNPVDLARVQVLLALELPTMMGYTGKILQKLLSGDMGMVLAGAGLLLWVSVPVWIGTEVFYRRDL